jgi:hypothetical protein
MTFHHTSAPADCRGHPPASIVIVSLPSLLAKDDPTSVRAGMVVELMGIRP